MPYLTRRSARLALLILVALALPLAACHGDDDPSEPDGIALGVAGVVAAFEGSGVDCAAFPVTIFDLGDRGGSLDFVEATALRSADSAALATNRRPNEDFAYADTALPPGGELEAEAAVCWPPEPMGTGLAVRVTAQVGPGARSASVVVAMTGPRE